WTRQPASDPRSQTAEPQNNRCDVAASCPHSISAKGLVCCTDRLSPPLKAFRIEEKLAPDLEEALNSEDFKAWTAGKIGLHWPQSNYASISSRLTPATTVGLALHYLRTFGKRPTKS
ncbi:hypothetical protein, partial [Bradyrhizobium sp. NAS80.1]|uniref:hypothetical protein n=1 Tax=Bradyrhizobium sp. NAS80.1 TaxID=1680159 RepID=UPI001AEFEECB